MLKVNKEGIHKLCIILLVISFPCLRPAIQGNRFTSLGIIIVALSFFAYIISEKKFYISKKNREIWIASSIFWLYCLIQAMIKNSVGIDNAIKAVVINFALICMYSVLLSNETIERGFFRIFICVLCLFAVSYLCTLVISLTINLNKLFLFSIPIEGYYGKLDVYFPFSIEYGKIRVLGHWVIRGSSLFREVGIAQIFYLWGIVACNNYFEKYIKLIRGLLAIGIILCFSTTGYILLILIIGLMTIFNRKFSAKDEEKGSKLKRYLTICLLCVICVGAMWAFTHVEGITLADKQEVSITDRTSAITVSMNKLNEKFIFGWGFCNNSRHSSTSNSFIANLYSIGIVGGILHVFIFVLAIINVNRNKRIKFICSLIPLVVTGLFTQPLMDAPLIYLLLLANSE